MSEHSEELNLIRSAARKTVSQRCGTGLIQQTSDENSLEGSFIFDIANRHCGMTLGFKLENRDETFWQRLIIDGRDWYTTKQPEPTEVITERDWSKSESGWIVMPGLDFPTAPPLIGLYWLAGVVDVTRQLSDEQRIFDVWVSVDEAVMQVDAADRVGVAESKDQLKSGRDRFAARVTINTDGLVMATELSINTEMDLSVRFTELGNSIHVPIPDEADRVELSRDLVDTGILQAPETFPGPQ